MFINPHPYIKKVSRDLEAPLSVFRMTQVKMDTNQNLKHELVYVNSSFPAKDYNEVIYKTEGGIYLLYKTVGSSGYYALECYFPHEKISQVKIFLNSILKKNDTSNSTRS